MLVKRSLAATLTGALAISGLAACGGSSSVGASKPSATGAATTTAAGATTGTPATTGAAPATTGAAPTTGASAVKPSGVLNVGMPNGPQTDNNNPFLGSSAGASLGYRAMIWEPLVMMNPINPSADGRPWLATKWAWSKNFTQVDFTIRDGVKWSDGQPMTAADVAFTFNLLKKYDALNGNALPIVSATSSGSTATITFKSSQFVNQTKVVTQIVVPQHIWASIKDPTTDPIKTPVGTGPYALKSFTSQTITLQVRDSYWQALPKVATLRYTSYTDNNSETTALANGTAEWGFVFIPNINAVYVNKDKAHNKLWFPPNLGAHGLWINTTKAPFDDPTLRQAMNMVINRADIFNQGEAGYFYPQITNITGIPTPAGNSFIADKYQNKNATIDVAGAKALLTSAGYTYSGSTLKDKTGKAVSIVLSDPAGWSDYITDLTIIADNLKQIGISATVDKANQDAWFKNVDTGEFGAVMHWTNGGATPYDEYENILDSAVAKPIGKPGSLGNYGRFKDPAADAALTKYATASSDADRKAALATLEDIMVAQVPVLLTSAANVGGEYNTKHWVGWPDASNPYSPPQPTQINALDVVLHLSPAS
jgi:peptide/nickel transport system substrate-binding protein